MEFILSDLSITLCTYSLKCSGGIKGIHGSLTLLVTQTIKHGLHFSPVNYLFKIYLFHTINNICFQMLLYSRCVRHVCFGINGPITAQLSNGPWQGSGIAWSHLLLSFTFPYINLPITEDEKHTLLLLNLPYSNFNLCALIPKLGSEIRCPGKSEHFRPHMRHPSRFTPNCWKPVICHSWWTANPTI